MDWTNPWITGPLCAGIGILIGLFLARLLGDKSSGSAALEELRTEFDEYREGVSRHFDTTSELFKDMTEKYRDVYNHMAGGAQTFGAAGDSPARLEIVSEADRLESVEDTGDTPTDAETSIDVDAEPEPAAEAASDEASAPELESVESETATGDDAKVDLDGESAAPQSTSAEAPRKKD